MKLMKQINLFKKGFVIFLKGATFSDFFETRLLNYKPLAIRICFPLFWEIFFQLGSNLIKKWGWWIHRLTLYLIDFHNYLSKMMQEWPQHDRKDYNSFRLCLRPLYLLWHREVTSQKPRNLSSFGKHWRIFVGFLYPSQQANGDSASLVHGTNLYR